VKDPTNHRHTPVESTPGSAESGRGEKAHTPKAEDEAASPAPITWQDLESEYRLDIDTPENVVFGYEIAGIGSRFLAALIDTLLIAILQIIAGLSVLFLTILLPEGILPSIWISALGLIAFLFLWGYYIFFEMTWNGQSPGKRKVGLRVIRTDGTPITFTESLVRNLIRLVDFLPAYYGIGVVTMFIDSRSRRLGDLAAGTLVVRDQGPVTLESLEAEPTRSVAARPPQIDGIDLPLERLSSQDIQLAEDFLRRRHQLINAETVAYQVAKLLLERMNLSIHQIGPMSTSDLILKIVQASHSWET